MKGGKLVENRKSVFVIVNRERRFYMGFFWFILWYLFDLFCLGIGIVMRWYGFRRRYDFDRFIFLRRRLRVYFLY